MTHRAVLLDCDICRKRFSFPSYLERHVKVHESLGRRKWRGKKEGGEPDEKRVDVWGEHSNNKARLERIQELALPLLVAAPAPVQNTAIVTPPSLDIADAAMLSGGDNGKIFNMTDNKKVEITLKPKIDKYTYERRGKYYSCSCCKKQLKSLRSVRSHMVIFHTVDRPYACKLCFKRYHLPQGLRVHEKSHQPKVKNYMCNECGFAFLTKAELMKHMRVHRPPEYKCLLCPKAFRSKHLLRDHTTTHTGEKLHLCKLCPKKFHFFSLLRKHLYRRHSNDRPHKCTLCDKRFVLPCILKQHMAVHTGIRAKKPAKQICEQCGKAVHQLKSHMVVHTKIRAFKCDVCGKAFTKPHHVQNHMLSIHSDKRPFPCPKCDWSFKRAQHLTSHLSTKHGQTSAEQDEQ